MVVRPTRHRRACDTRLHTEVVLAPEVDGHLFGPGEGVYEPGSSVVTISVGIDIVAHVGSALGTCGTATSFDTNSVYSDK